MNGLALDLGRRGYDEVWKLQSRLVDARARDEIPDTLILVEHDHVITLGRRTSNENLLPQSIPVYHVDRGGDATYHGPGQLVGYPIIKLSDHDVHRYLRLLEEVLIRASRKYGINSERKQGHTGVWASGKKLASIGVAVNKWITFHGFALNVNTDLEYFGLIRPCGLDPSTMTSMKALFGREINLEEVKRTTESEFEEVFGLELTPRKLIDIQI
jgi:lipoate-protein ligase B